MRMTTWEGKREGARDGEGKNKKVRQAGRYTFI